MSRRDDKHARDKLWLEMVERAETLNDVVVLSQRRPSITSAGRIRSLAKQLLARSNAVITLMEVMRDGKR